MSRALIPSLTVLAAVLVVFSTVASGNRAAESIQRQLDGQLERSGMALRAAVAAADSRALALALESARDDRLVHAMEGSARRTAGPDKDALEAATGAVASLTERRGEDERADYLGLANGRGAADSRLGEPARFGLDGLPLTEAALAGAGKTGWVEFDGKLLRLAAVPVGGSARPAGALVVGHAVDDRLAQRLAAETGAAVTLLQGQRVVASSLNAEQRSQVASAAGGGTGVFALGAAPEGFSFLGISLPLGGAEASRVRALSVSLPGVEEGRAILSVDGAAPLAPAAAGQRQGLWAALATLLVGLAFVLLDRRASGGSTVRELAAAAEALVVGDLSVRAPEGLPGELGRLSDAVNRLFAKKAAERELSSRAQAAEAVAAKIKERRAAERTPPPVEPTPTPAEAMEEPAAAAPVEPAATPLEASPGPGWGSTPPPFEPPVPPPPPATPSPSPASFWDRPTQAISREEAVAAARAAEAELAGASSFENTPAPEPFNPEATVVAAVPEALLRATSRAPARPVLSSPVSSRDPDEAHFEQVFRDFVATRERCGEPTQGLGYDRFAAKLRKNREQLMEKYHCRSVRFTVYVKEGRAALKATPVKE